MLQHDKGDLELFSVYVPTNHVYVGDIFLLGKADIIKTNLSVREGLGEPCRAILPAARSVPGFVCWTADSLAACCCRDCGVCGDGTAADAQSPAHPWRLACNDGAQMDRAALTFSSFRLGLQISHHVMLWGCTHLVAAGRAVSVSAGSSSLPSSVRAGAHRAIG